MSIRQGLKWLQSIENETFEKIRTGVTEGVKKKFVAQEIARSVFLAHFPPGESMATEGNWICRYIFSGGLAAAAELDWKLEKAAKQLARGLLAGIRERGGDFMTGACTVVRSAIQCALLTKADINKVTENVIGAVHKQGREENCNLEELLIGVSRTAVNAAQAFPKEDFKSIEQMFMGLLEGKTHFDEEGNYLH